MSDVFGLPTKVSKDDDRAIVEEGKERLMSMGELINANLPDLTAVEDDTGRAGGGREPTVDRTGVKAQVDSVIVAAKAAESTWRRFNDASLRALARTKAKGINDRMETARAELAGAKLARDAVTQHSMDVDPAVRAAMRATIEEKIAKANTEVASFADEHAKFLEAEAEARAAWRERVRAGVQAAVRGGTQTHAAHPAARGGTRGEADREGALTRGQGPSAQGPEVEGARIRQGSGGEARD